MTGDGVALNSISHPELKGWAKISNRLLRSWLLVTWPMRKHKVVEDIEIDLSKPGPPLFLKGAITDAYATGWRPNGFGGRPLR